MQNVFSKLSSYFTPQVKNRLAQATGWTSYPSTQQPAQTAASSNLIRNAMNTASNVVNPPKLMPPTTNPQYGPLKTGYVAAPGYKPPVVASAPNVAPPQQTTAYDAYNQKYNAALLQSKARKEQEAAADKAESEKQAQEQYDANKGTYTTARTNVDQLMAQYRDRIAASDARLTQVAGQNRERATTTSGENQRQLAIDRRQAMNDTEKRYAALGTLDSFGTGSFQTAVENKDSDFLRLTAKNKQQTQYDLEDIDNKLFDAKAKIEEQKATEEGKYNDAVAQINSLLANDEVSKNQALRAASLVYQQKIGQINDENDSLTLAAEKEKADLQMKLQSASMDEQKLRSLFTSASPDFLKTGQPTTAEDQFLIFKYPKEAEAYVKMLGGGKSELTAAQENKVQLANSGLRALSEIEQMIQKDPNKIFMNALPGQLGARDYSSAAFRAVEGLLRARSGAAIPETEVVRYMNANLPRVGDNESDIRYKLDAFKKDLLDVANSGSLMASQSAGGNKVTVVSPEGVEGTMDESELQDAINNGYKLK